VFDIQSKLLLIGISPQRGRGIFTKVKISSGQILGLTPSWEISPEDISAMERSSIEGFWFEHPQKSDWGLLPLGISALINHSKSPNSVLNWSNTEIGYVGILLSKREIEKGEEIFIDYNINPPEDWV